MKKHYIIIGIILLSALFFIPAVIKKYNSSKGGTDVENDPSTLNARIEKIGQNPWDQVSYDALIGEINGLASDQQISASERDNYRSTLNINMQNALAISYKKSLSESCYATNTVILNRASDTISNPISELSRQKSIYISYKRALGFKTTLNIFLSNMYSEEGATKLKNSFLRAYTGQAFQNCSNIQTLKIEIDQKLTDFKKFVADYNFKLKSGDPDFDYYNDDPVLLSELKSHSFYYKEFLSLKK